MHILHLTPYYAPAYSFGGVVRMVEGLAKAQIAQGQQVTILTTDAYTQNARYHGDLDEVQDGIRIIRCLNAIYPLRRYNLDTPFGIGKYAKQLMPSVGIVHIHEFRTVENLIVTPIAARYHKPIVLSPHGTLTYATGRSLVKSLWDKILSPRIARNVHHVIALTQSELEDSRVLWSNIGNPNTKFSVVPNGVNLSDYRSLPDAATFRQKYKLGNARVVLFLGRLHRRKGVAELAQAFLQADLPDTKLVLAGPDDGMRPMLQSLVNENIILTGFLNGDERLAALSAADLFVLPATGEGLSMAVLEAMAAGLPVLLSPGCNLPEAETAQAGLIVPPTVSDLTAALKSLVADNTKLKMMGQNAQKLIADKFTWKKVATQIEVIYKNLSTP